MVSFGVSFPRIQDMLAEFTPKDTMSNLNFVKVIAAFRLIFPDLIITLSTRESASLRNNLIKCGITTLSVESKTNPGGYSGDTSEEQFSISDHRPIHEIKELLITSGYDPIVKNWD